MKRKMQYEFLEFMGLGRVRWTQMTRWQYIMYRIFNPRHPVRKFFAPSEGKKGLQPKGMF